MSEASGTLPCPTCGAIAERRISAGGGMIFKGSGFYITDYGKDGKKDQRDKTAADAKKSAAVPSTGTGDATTAKPADAKGEKKGEKPAPAVVTPSTGKSEA